MPEALRVLAVDPALRNTGYAVLQSDGGNISALTYGVVSNAAKLSHAGCLLAIRDQLTAVIKEFHPVECAIESTIYVQSFKTAITLGSVRGAVLIAAAEQGLTVHDYAPREVKQAAVGRGGAGKEQVAFMVRSMLRLRETPQSDAADALAVGIAHLQASVGAFATKRERPRI